MIWRYRLTLLCLLGVFLVIIARLFYWQVVKAEELAALGQSQYGQFLKIQPERGEIKASDGYSLAANKLGYLVFANGKEIKDRQKTIDILSPILQVDTATLSALLDPEKVWIPLKSKVPASAKEQIEKLKLSGIGFEQQFTRFYPEASMAAHLLGFVGKDRNGEDKGYFGLEGEYNRQLHGKTQLVSQAHDALGRPILAKMDGSASDNDGRTLITSIDRVIQFSVESRLKNGLEKYGAVGGMAAVMDPKTGSILAMASYPSFNPSSYNDFPVEYYANPFIASLYEPGSTFKSLIVAAALDAKVIKPETRCTICAGPVEISGYEIRTWNNKYEDGMTMIDVIRHSDNTGMVFISQQLGIERMRAYLQKFGIGELTGVDLQGEATAPLRKADDWYQIDTATLSFGQGVSVTGISLLNAFSSIANEGNRMEPHIVAKIETPDGEIIPIKPKIVEKTISSATAKVMTEILVNAVNNGEAQWVKPKGYRLAGKTGTAQIPVAGHYDPNKTIASFIGYAPADDPKFAMLVIVDKPTTSIYGAETAAPIFMEIAKDIFSYYNIAPTE